MTFIGNYIMYKIFYITGIDNIIIQRYYISNKPATPLLACASLVGIFFARIRSSLYV